MRVEGQCRRVLSLFIIFLGFLPVIPQMHAQTPDFSKFTMKVSAGMGLTTGELGDYLDSGFIFTTGVGYNLNPRIGFLGEYLYNTPPINQKKLDQLTVPIGEAKIWAITGNPMIRMNRPGKVDFYVTGGGGIYQRKIRFPSAAQGTITISSPWWGKVGVITIKPGTTLGTHNSTAFGLNIGGGVLFDVAKGFKGYAEVRYHHAFTETSSTQIVPITFGVRW